MIGNKSAQIFPRLASAQNGPPNMHFGLAPPPPKDPQKVEKEASERYGRDRERESQVMEGSVSVILFLPPSSSSSAFIFKCLTFSPNNPGLPPSLPPSIYPGAVFFSFIISLFKESGGGRVEYKPQCLFLYSGFPLAVARIHSTFASCVATSPTQPARLD